MHSTTRPMHKYFHNLKEVGENKRREKFFKYEHVLWTIHSLVTILAIIDRFTSNINPRQSYRIGRGSAGNDRMVGLKEGPWSVAVYDILARVSGRYSIVTFNFMLIVRLHFLEQYLASSWISERILDCSNITKANLDAHKINGIGLCVMTLIHIWSILLPCITHKWGAQVVPGTFEWPLSERTPPGFKDADPVNKMMSLQVDDVFRLVEMTLLLAVITPLSIRWMQKYWHLGIQVHRFVNVLYFVDIVRRHSHPHSWVLNTPVFVIWILDKVYSMDWRRINKPNFIYERISDDYMVLYWNHEHKISQNLVLKEKQGVGSNYFMKLYPSSWLEPRHPFTTFTSRGGNCDHLLVDNNAGGKKWNSGAVVRIFHNHRKPQIGSEFESRSHTERIANAFEATRNHTNNHGLQVWGPFQGDMTEMIPRALFNASSLLGTSSSSCGSTLVLVGTGSAVNFMIDFMSYLVEQMKNNGIETNRTDRFNCILLYSTRDIALYNWSVEAMNILLLQNEEYQSSSCEVDVRIIMSCTSGTSDVLDMEEFQLSNRMTCLDRRIDYVERIPENSVVFCQGSMQIQNVVKSACCKKQQVKVYFD